ncbi:MAG TPA: endo-1,4-beta-xylanase, partial [Terriglobales bacterium]|nr:endo-1,4-beta-xylanase [Terriglobales bacterium]
GLLTGAAVAIPLLRSDPVYAQVLSEQYSILVAENAMKWRALRPAPDRFSFDAANELVTFAEKNAIKVRGHNLCWHESLPDWFAGTVTKENAQQFLTDHIMTVAGHYKGKIHSWDVVNEAVDAKSGREDGLRTSPWFEMLGPGYLDIAYRTAREADPDALLTYNEYGIEYDNEEESRKRAFTLQLLRRLKGSNVPLDAVGIQSHIRAGSPFTFGKGIREFIASAREMGLQVFITEMDVNGDELAYDDIEKIDHATAAVYRDYLSTVLANPAVTAVLTWGVSDAHSWLNSPMRKQRHPNRPQRPLPFDENYRPKEAFFAMRGGFDHREVKG